MTDLEEATKSDGNQQEPKSKGFSYGWIIVGLVAMGVFGAILGSSGGSDSPGNSGSWDGADEYGAWVICEDFVKDRLKSPSSARFSGSLDTTRVDAGDETWIIIGHVDAQNSFGAEIRNMYSCETKYVGNDRWTLVDLSMW